MLLGGTVVEAVAWHDTLLCHLREIMNILDSYVEWLLLQNIKKIKKQNKTKNGGKREKSQYEFNVYM